MAILVLPKLATEHQRREKELLQKALEEGGWRLTGAACVLGISPTTLHNALRRHPELEKRRLDSKVETSRRYSPIEALASEFREREYAQVEAALVRAEWSVSGAAKILGVKPGALHTLLRGRCSELGTKRLQESFDQKIAKRAPAAKKRKAA